MSAAVMDIEEMQANAGQAAAVLKSLANPARLLVLCALVNRGHSVGELEELTGLAQSALSQHLARLRDEKIVAAQRDGQRMVYQLCDSRIAVILQALHSQFCPEAFGD